MKKIILTLITLLTVMMIPMVKAADILTFSASETKDGVINVSGTVENSVVAAAILVYDSTGQNLITIETTQINDDNTFSANIAVGAGTYVVKVANYEGGDYVTATVTNGSQIPNVPNTLDNIGLYIVLGIITLASLITGIIYLNKKKLVK